MSLSNKLELINFQTSFGENMNRSIGPHAPFIKLLYSAEKKQRKVLLQTITDNQLRILCEITLNIYQGNLEVSACYIKRLTAHRKTIEVLIDRKVSRKRKRELIIRKQSLIPLLIEPYISLQLKNHGARARTRTSRKIRSTDDDREESSNERLQGKL